MNQIGFYLFVHLLLQIIFKIIKSKLREFELGGGRVIYSPTEATKCIDFVGGRSDAVASRRTVNGGELICLFNGAAEKREILFKEKKEKTERIQSSPKTENAYREIPICRQLLRSLKLVHKEGGTPFVVGVSERSQEPRSYRDYYNRLLKRLDIEPIVFHGLRHTFATRCVESQCEYKTLSVILGHSNVATTMNLYVHPNLDQKKKCIERISKFLGN